MSLGVLVAEIPKARLCGLLERDRLAVGISGRLYSEQDALRQSVVLRANEQVNNSLGDLILKAHSTVGKV